MHPNPAFRKASTVANLAFAAKRGFGVLILNGPDGPLASHIPFIIRDRRLEAHLVRSNPIIRALSEPQDALMAVSGADAYISPDWYEKPNLVPTWNYVAVHLRGQIEQLPQKALRAHLERLSERFERDLTQKPVWRLDKVEPDVLDRMQRMIVPVAMRIASIDGTWKLGQNKGEAARMAAADGVQAWNSQMAELMRNAGAE
jgi:transcriptional regulator